MYELGQQLKNKDGRIATIEKISGIKRLVLRRDNNDIEKTYMIRKINPKEWEVVE